MGGGIMCCPMVCGRLAIRSGHSVAETLCSAVVDEAVVAALLLCGVPTRRQALESGPIRGALSLTLRRNDFRGGDGVCSRMVHVPPIAHPRDPLHGITLETIVTTLVERHGWAELGRRLPVRCFLHNPSVKSSLTFLRKTPWARERVEGMYIAELP